MTAASQHGRSPDPDLLRAEVIHELQASDGASRRRVFIQLQSRDPALALEILVGCDPEQVAGLPCKLLMEVRGLRSRPFRAEELREWLTGLGEDPRTIVQELSPTDPLPEENS